MVREFFISGFSQSLEQLADRIDDNTDPRRKKTTVRRLYDITNVLKALGLVKKSVSPEKNVMIEWQGNFLFRQGLEGLVEAETKNTINSGLDCPFRFGTPTHSLFQTPGPKVPNMQSAFRVSKSVIFEQTSPASLGKRPLDHIPQAVMDSIEGLVDPTKLIIAEPRRGQKIEAKFSQNKEAYLDNIENIHPNLKEQYRLPIKPFFNDSLTTRIPMGVISFNEEAQI
jgi:hypothetical protein